MIGIIYFIIQQHTNIIKIMANIIKIKKHINVMLERSGAEYLLAPETNEELERVKLLNDCPSRKGKPLRELIRRNLIEAIKVEGRWHIIRQTI